MQNAPTNPLDQLRDIHLPDAVSIWPLAAGWWFIALTIICCVVLGIYWHRRGRWQRQAKDALRACPPQATQSYYSHVNRVLKQVALHRFGSQCAQLSGMAWLEFLDSKLAKPVFTKEQADFAQAPDNPNVMLDPILLQQHALQWIVRHKLR